MSEKNILQSVYKPTSKYNLDKNVSLAKFLLEEATKNAQKGRLNWITNSISGESIQFSDIDPLSKKVAIFLNEHGMRRGDVAIYLTTDVTKIYLIILGIWRLGGTVFSSYVEDTKETLLDRIRNSYAKFIFCDPSAVIACQNAVSESGRKIEIFVFGFSPGCTPVSSIFDQSGSSVQKINESEESCEKNSQSEKSSDKNSKLDDNYVFESGENEPALILCTSGTTGKSKGAIYTNKSLMAFVRGLDGFPWNKNPFLYLVKCTHVLGILFPMRNIADGSWAVMMNQITKTHIYEAIQKYKPFLAFGFPTYLMAIVEDEEAQKYDRSSLEVMCTGGLVIQPQVYETLLKLPNMRVVMNGFGMTECGAITTTVDLTSSDEYKVAPNMPPLSVGRLYPSTSLKVLNLDTGLPVGPNLKGELCVKSPVMAVGYLGMSGENKETFENGWLKTGDIGYYDENGFVFICGRLKDTFKYYNNHISPDELEEVLLQHPSVKEVSIFGVKDEGGDVPKAAIVLKDSFKLTTTDDELIKFINSKVASYKALRGGVIFLDSLPRGNTGKVSRALLSQIYS